MGAGHIGHIEDLNGDGIDDMVLHFREGELGIATGTPGNTILSLTLTGQLLDGAYFEGVDDVRITPNNSESRGKGGQRSEVNKTSLGLKPALVAGCNYWPACRF
jgi:hypothetical protein